jgi:hypothetical protein
MIHFRENVIRLTAFPRRKSSRQFDLPESLC